jgi:hypothetical protein
VKPCMVFPRTTPEHIEASRFLQPKTNAAGTRSGRERL